MDWTPIGHWTLPCKILDPRLQGSTSRGSICDTILLPTINTRRVPGSTCCAVNSTKIRNPMETLLHPKFRINSSTWLHFNGRESTISLRRGCSDKLTRSRAYDSAVSASRERQITANTLDVLRPTDSTQAVFIENLYVTRMNKSGGKTKGK